MIILAAGLILMLILNLFLIFYLHKSRVLINSLSRDKIRLQDKTRLLVNSLTLNLASRIKEEGSYLTNLSLDKLKLKSSLILWFNTKSCQVCLESIINSLNKIDNYSKNKIIILSSFNSYAEHRYYLNGLLKQFLVIECKDSVCMKKYWANENYSVFFTLDNELKIRNLFIPDKNCPILTDIYLKNILSWLKK